MHKLLTVGRKYGAVVHWAATRAADVPKSALAETTRKIIGQADSDADEKRAAQIARVKADDIANLQPLNFFCRETGKAAEPVRIVWIKPRQVMLKVRFFK